MLRDQAADKQPQRTEALDPKVALHFWGEFDAFLLAESIGQDGKPDPLFTDAALRVRPMLSRGGLPGKPDLRAGAIQPPSKGRLGSR